MCGNLCEGTFTQISEVNFAVLFTVLCFNDFSSLFRINVTVIYILLYILQYDIFQICSGITRGRVLTGELYEQRLQVNLFAFVYRLFPEDFSAAPSIEEKSSWKQSLDKCRKISFCNLCIIQYAIVLNRFDVMRWDVPLRRCILCAVQETVWWCARLSKWWWWNLLWLLLVSR